MEQSALAGPPGFRAVIVLIRIHGTLASGSGEAPVRRSFGELCRGVDDPVGRRDLGQEPPDLLVTRVHKHLAVAVVCSVCVGFGSGSPPRSRPDRSPAPVASNHQLAMVTPHSLASGDGGFASSSAQAVAVRSKGKAASGAANRLTRRMC